MNNKKLKKMLLFKKKKEKNLGSQIIQSKSIKEYRQEFFFVKWPFEKYLEETFTYISMTITWLLLKY